MSWTAEHERDHVGDVPGGDLGLAVELLDALAGFVVGDVLGQLGRDDAGFDERDPYVGEQLLSQRLRPAVDPPLVAA
jgi:hypothetical protein